MISHGNGDPGSLREREDLKGGHKEQQKKRNEGEGEEVEDG